MEKQEAHSYNDIINSVKNAPDDFRELIGLCRKTHELAFDFNTAKTFGSKEKTEGLEKDITYHQKKILDIIKGCFSYNPDAINLSEQNLFNEIIMPLSKIEDR